MRETVAPEKSGRAGRVLLTLCGIILLLAAVGGVMIFYYPATWNRLTGGLNLGGLGGLGNLNFGDLGDFGIGEVTAYIPLITAAVFDGAIQLWVWARSLAPTAGQGLAVSSAVSSVWRDWPWLAAGAAVFGVFMLYYLAHRLSRPKQPAPAAPTIDPAAPAKARAMQTAHLAKQGVAAARNAASGMVSARNQVEEAGKRLGGFEQNLRRIADTAEQVRGIAEQAGVLLLNASVQAARTDWSGGGVDSGRGFGVAAEEMQQLAERAGRKAGETAELARNLHGNAVGASAALKNAPDEIAAVAALTDQAAEALAQIETASREVLEGIEARAAQAGNSAEQSAGPIHVPSLRP